MKTNGYYCRCHKFHLFHAYVYAHMNIDLIHTCSCGRQYNIFQGVATFIGLEPKKEVMLR